MFWLRGDAIHSILATLLLWQVAQQPVLVGALPRTLSGKTCPVEHVTDTWFICMNFTIASQDRLEWASNFTDNYLQLAEDLCVAAYPSSFDVGADFGSGPSDTTRCYPVNVNLNLVRGASATQQEVFGCVHFDKQSDGCPFCFGGEFCNALPRCGSFLCCYFGLCRRRRAQLNDFEAEEVEAEEAVYA